MNNPLKLKYGTLRHLECEEEEEGHHKTEETHSLGESKSKDSVREQLLLQAGVPKIRIGSRIWTPVSQQDIYPIWFHLAANVIQIVSSHKSTMKPQLEIINFSRENQEKNFLN